MESQAILQGRIQAEIFLLNRSTEEDEATATTRHPPPLDRSSDEGFSHLRYLANETTATPGLYRLRLNTNGKSRN